MIFIRVVRCMFDAMILICPRRKKWAGGGRRDSTDTKSRRHCRSAVSRRSQRSSHSEFSCLSSSD